MSVSKSIKGSGSPPNHALHRGRSSTCTDGRSTRNMEAARRTGAARCGWLLSADPSLGISSPEASRAERSQCAPAHLHLPEVCLANSLAHVMSPGGSESLFLPWRAGGSETLTPPSTVSVPFGVAAQRPTLVDAGLHRGFCGYCSTIMRWPRMRAAPCLKSC